MGNSRNSYLIKNTMIFTLGNLGSKLISFFLIPLYTNALTTTEYGVVDLIATVGTVAAPVLTLNICESVMRFALDKDANKDKITQIGTNLLLIGMVVGLVIFPICHSFNRISQYSVFVYFYVISLAASQLYLCDLRGKELLVYYSIGNVLHTFFIAALNILFLVVFKGGIEGYLNAYIIANILTATYALIMGKGYRSFSFSGVDKKLLQRMIRYSIVLIPNSFMWWIMNSSDRVMVSSMVGIAANGIYAVSYKLPTLVSTLTTIFNQAWSYSAIREEGTEDENEYNNKIFRTLRQVKILRKKVKHGNGYWFKIPYTTAAIIKKIINKLRETEQEEYVSSFLKKCNSTVYREILIPDQFEAIKAARKGERQKVLDLADELKDITIKVGDNS